MADSALGRRPQWGARLRLLADCSLGVRERLHSAVQAACATHTGHCAAVSGKNYVRRSAGRCDVRRFNLRCSLLALIIAGGTSLGVRAESEYASPEFDPKHSGSFTSPNEWIDNFSGGLNIIEKDVILKGPDGFDMVVTRWYSSKINQWDSNCLILDRESGPLGVGWQYHQGRLWDNPIDTAVPAYRLELPGGMHESFYHDTVLGVPSADFVSPGGWSLRSGACVGELGNCWIATSPAGISYHFPQSSNYRMDPDNAYAYVRTIIDPKYNRITVDYDFGCNCNQAYIRSITDMWGRQVQFHYTAGVQGPRFCSLDTEESCLADADCQNYCSGGGTQQACTNNFNCGAGTCSDNGQPCTSSNGCQRHCSNNGQSCTQDSQCGTRQCVGGANAGATCTSELNCHDICQGGSNPGANCDSGSWQCNGVCSGTATACPAGGCGWRCVGGSDNGDSCTPGQSCHDLCVGGFNAGQSCTNDYQCRNACVGGRDDGNMCTNEIECHDYCYVNSSIPCSLDYQCQASASDYCVRSTCSNVGSCFDATCQQRECIEGACNVGTCSAGAVCQQASCNPTAICLSSTCQPSVTGPRYLESLTLAWVNGTVTYRYGVDTTTHIDPVLRSFQTPTGQTATYGYAPAGGEPSYDIELKSITLPTGGTISYVYEDHQFFYPLRNTGQGVECTRVVKTKSLGSDTWTFSWPTGQPNDRTTIVTDPQGASRRFTYYRYSSTGSDRIWKAGLLEKLEIVDGGTSLVEELYTYLPQQISTDNVSARTGYTESAQVARLIDKQTTQNPGGKTSRVKWGQHDRYGNPGWTEDYGYDGTLYRKTVYEYAHNSATFENAHIVDRPTLIRTLTNDGVMAAEITNVYYDTVGGGGAFGNLNSTQTWANPGYVTSTFRYDIYGNLTQRQVSGGGVTRTTDYTFSFGVLDTLVEGGRTVFNRTIHPYSSLVTAEQNANGGTTNFGYDNWSRLTSIDPPGSDPTTSISYGATTITVSRGTGESFYTYDSYGRLRQSRTKVAGSMYNYDLVDYDSRGEVQKKYEPSHSASPPVFTSFTRDALGRPLSATNPDGTTAFTYTADEVAINDGVSTRVITYDAFGRIVKVREGGYLTEYGYDILDNLVLVKNPGSAGDRIFTWSPAGWLRTENHPETGLVVYGVNGVGERTSKTTLDGLAESYTLDAEGRITLIDRPGTDNDARLYYDGSGVLGHPVTYSNASGFLTGMTDPTGSTVWPQRDVNGRTLSIENKRGVTVYGSSIQYDAQGNLSRVDYPHVGSTSRSVVDYSYNDGGLVNGVTLNGQAIVSDIQYNPLMSPDKLVYANGVTVNVPTLESERNRPTGITSVGATVNGSPANAALAFDYNSRGQVQTINRNGSLETYGYEPDRGFLTSATYGTGSVSYVYDSDGNMTNRSSVAFPTLNFTRPHTNNKITNCSYSSAGNLQSCDGHTYLYYSNATLQRADNVAQYQYDAKDRLNSTLVVGSNLIHADMYVEPLGRLSRFEGPNGSSLIPNMDWVYAAGQLVASVDYGPACGCQPKTCASERKTCGTISDGCGGTAFCGVCGGGGTCIRSRPKLEFPNGWMLQQQGEGEELPGTALRICNGTQNAVRFSTTVQFDSGEEFPLDLVHEDTVPPETDYTIPTSFDSTDLAPGVYEATIIVTTDDPTVDPVETPVVFVVSDGTTPETPSAITGQLRWYVADHRGTTMMVLDSAGKVVANYEYFPFGELKSQSACGRNEGLYQGVPRDSDANLYDLGARRHAPQFARFLVPDTAWPDLRLPSDWNRYLYSSNDPVNLIDLLGYSTITKNGGINYYRNVDLYKDPRGLQSVVEVAANAVGGTISDLLGLDGIVDGIALSGDSSNSLQTRAWGTTKAAAITAFDVAGGVIVKKVVGGVVARVIGAFGEEIVTSTASRGARFIVSPGGTAVESKIADRWARGTFGNVVDSIAYHFTKHGGARTLEQYTDDAVRFFGDNKGRAQWGKWGPNWEPSFKLKIGNQGGYYNAAGQVLTYWD